GEGGPHDRRTAARVRGAAARRPRADQGRSGRPLGQPRLPLRRAELRPDHGHRRGPHRGAGARVRRARRARPRVRGHARGVRRPRRRGGGAGMSALSRTQMAWRVAQDIPDASYVNLGIGLPTLVANYVPEGREVIYHSENGILGLGPAPKPGEEDPELINAGKELVTLLPGGAYFHHTDSFMIMRG